MLEGVKKPRIAAAAAELSVPIDEEWKLYYWSGNFKGRGEYIRLMFEAAEVPYEEVGDAEHILKLMDRNGRGEAPFPAFAPPMISGPGGVFLSQTPVCMARLGKAFGLFPQNEEDEFKALQIVLSVADYHGEGRSSFHPVDNTASYLTQVEEAKITTAKFAEGRMKTWLHHFEHLLSVSKSSYFVGSSMTYVDIAVFYALWATETQFPIEWGALDIPSLKAFKQRIASYRPIAAYLKSGRGRPFSGDSML